MVTDIQYTNSGISYLLSMDSKAMTEGVTCFPNIFFVTAFAFKVVGDPCQKITLLLLKSKSVRVIVTESCF